MKKILSVLLTLAVTQAVFAKTSVDLIAEKVHNLHPTQSSVGMASVDLKAQAFQKMTTKERMSFLRKHPVPVIIGPNQELYLIDHHHMGRALIKTGHQNLFIQVINDWSKKSMSTFWEDMEKNGYTYLYDTNNNRISPSELPKSLSLLKDDPYRSLAYFAREAGAFKKTSVPFEEFHWAAYYREHIGPDELSDWKTATKKAVEISLNPEACHLPGFKGSSPCTQ